MVVHFFSLLLWRPLQLLQPLRLEIKVCGTSSCENFGRICLDLELWLSPVVTYMQHLNCCFFSPRGQKHEAMSPRRPVLRGARFLLPRKQKDEVTSPRCPVLRGEKEISVSSPHAGKKNISFF